MGGKPDPELVKPAWEKVLTNPEIVLGLSGSQISGLERRGGVVRIGVRDAGPVICPHCQARQFRAWHPGRCPPVLGIDEHFFTRRLGYATTFCDLRHHKVYDVVLGRSEAALESYLQRLEGREQVRVVCLHLAPV